MVVESKSKHDERQAPHDPRGLHGELVTLIDQNVGSTPAASKLRVSARSHVLEPIDEILPKSAMKHTPRGTPSVRNNLAI